MIVCPNCQHHIPDDVEVCSNCGGSLEGFLYRLCPACGALSPAQNTFCHRCLAELKPGGAALKAAQDETIAPFVPTEPLPADLLIAPDALAQPQAGITSEQTPENAAADAAEPTEEQTHADDEGEQPAADDSVEPAAVAADEPDAATVPAAAHASEDPLTDLAASLPDSLIGDLAQTQDLLPLEAAVALPHRAHPPTFGRPGETEQYDAELFARISAEPASLNESRHVVLQRQQRLLPAIGRALLYLLVLLAALTPLLTGGQLFTSQAMLPGAEASALATSLNALPAGAHLLVSVDYDPAYAGELDPLTHTLLRQLAEREVNLVVMSTRPTGMGLAQRAFGVVSEETAAYQTYGERHALVGYLAGNEAALRTLSGSIDAAFKQDYVKHVPLSQLAATEGLATLAEFDAIIVLADDSQVVRRWIEQVHSRTQRPIYALVSARVKPLLQPYLSSGQLTALLGGASQGAEYSAASLGSAWKLAQGDAYVAYWGVLVLVAIVTNIAWVARKRTERS